MPPSQPSLVLTRLSSTSFSAQVQGSDPGVTNRVFYRDVDSLLNPDVTGPTLVGDGTAAVTGVTTEAHVMAWVVSDGGSGYSLPRFAWVSLVAAGSLLTALKDQWYGSPGLVALVPNGLYLSQVPDKSGAARLDPPFATVTAGATRFEWTMDTLCLEVTSVTFEAYAVGDAEGLEAIVSELRSAFDWARLTFADTQYVSLRLQPTGLAFAAEPVRSRDGSITYSATMSYEAVVSRTFPHYP